jgi:monoamine oxidase
MPQPVIVIGAGASGLSAARLLKAKGVPVLVLEGRDRLGGRTHTLDLAGQQNSWIDMGAAFIDDHLTNRVYKLLKEAGEEVKPLGDGSVFGTRIYDQSSASWLGWMTTLWTLIKYAWNQRKLTRTVESTEFRSLGERINRILGPAPARHDLYVHRTLPEALVGASVDDMHRNALSPSFWPFQQYQEKSMPMIIGGYRKLIDLLSKPLLPSEVLLNQAVSKIIIPKDPDFLSAYVRVETSTGESYEGSHVIVTVPMGVLKSGTITFEPPLPVAKQEVIQRIGSGNIERVVMTFKKPFWRTNPSKPSNFFCVPNPVAASGIFLDISATSGAGPGLPTSPCLFALFAGSEAQWLSKNPDAAIKRVLADLETMYPKNYEQPVATATTSWTSSPFSRGCYPYATKDTLPNDFAKMGEPTHGGRVHFGGDACGDVHVGYVEGAMESGEAAASAILKILEGRGA